MPGYVVFGGQKISIWRPRVRSRAGEEVELENYRHLRQDWRRRLRNPYAMTDYARELCRRASDILVSDF